MALDYDFDPKIAIPGARWIARRLAARASRKAQYEFFSNELVRDSGLGMDRDPRVMRESIRKVWTPEQLGAARASLLDEEIRVAG